MIAKIIKPRFHFHQDNCIAAFMILAPFFLPLSKYAVWLSWAGGAYLLLYNGLTNRPGSLAPILSEDRIHKPLDLAGVAALIVLPWFLFSTPLDRWYFVIQGIVTILLVLIIDFTPQQHSRPPAFLNAFHYILRVSGAFAAVLAALFVYSFVNARI